VAGSLVHGHSVGAVGHGTIGGCGISLIAVWLSLRSPISSGIGVAAGLGGVSMQLSVTFLMGTLKDLASMGSLVNFLVGILRDLLSVVTVACRMSITKHSTLV